MRKSTQDALASKRTGEPRANGVNRRVLLQAGAGVAAASALPQSANAQISETAPTDLPAGAGIGPYRSGTPAPAARATPLGRPYNMVLFISDEETYHVRPAENYALPGRAELQRRGTTFNEHYIGSAMCTPSRGVIFSGQPPQVNGVYDQMELGYVPSLATDKPSMGTIVKQLGYETAYFGKFELRKDIITPKDTVNYTEALREYGFDTFAPDGDKVGSPDQAYDTDTYTGGEAIRWLRTNAHEMNRQGKPWFLVVSFVSPHDIMYADANVPGKLVQQSQVGMKITPPPDNTHFATQWKFPESPSHFQPMDAPGRPRAQLTYRIGWSEFLGDIPIHAAQMWTVYYNYYLNLIRDNDRNLQAVVDTLSALDLWDSTVVLRTADHGELGGSHGGLRGKGPLPYEQETHVPAVIVHPEHPGGRNCGALTSHIDLIPTLVGLTGADAKQQKDAVKGLPGHDFSSLLEDPETMASNAIRDAVLFNYVGLQTVDAVYMTRVCRDIAEGRYYAPDDFNTPKTLEEILANNEIELFDLHSDPHEVVNLGVDAETNKDLILRMNDLLNRLIAREVGVNDGSFLPAVLRDSMGPTQKP
jgi:arylsulfatase A-like enzyme